MTTRPPSVFSCVQKTAYDMRSSDWGSDGCSSQLHAPRANNGDDEAYRYRPPRSRHGHQEQRLHLQFREYRSEADSGLLDPAGAISVHHDLQSERNRARAAPASRCDIQLPPRMGHPIAVAETG